MRSTFPLSLKVTAWLLLNLTVLGALGLGLVLAQGGFGWDAVVRGPAGHRALEAGSALVAKIADAKPAQRAAALAESNAAGVTYYILRDGASVLDDTEPPLPPPVRERALQRPPEDRPPVDGTPPSRFDPQAAEGRPPPPHDEPRGRFLIRAGSPAAYWLGVRVAPPGDGRTLRGPLTVLARADSWWTLAGLLDLQSWLLVAAIVLGVSVLLWLPFVHALTRDIRRLTAATRQIADGRFETRVAATRRDELGQLGESVNTMAGRLDRLVGGQRRFLGDVTHELASPLARLQVAVEILGQRAPAGLQAQLTDVREEVTQMSTLVGELLAFTRAGLRPRDRALAEVPLAPSLQAMLRREDPAGSVRCDVDPTLAVRADPGLLSLALGNLVRNALRYAAPGGTIEVSASRDGERVVVIVDDEGPGVPPESLERLGEPFYRPDAARTRETGGVGLGLAIVRDSIAACDGEVRFSNRTPRGFRAELSMMGA